jgi:hypothetical protein
MNPTPEPGGISPPALKARTFDRAAQQAVIISQEYSMSTNTTVQEKIKIARNAFFMSLAAAGLSAAYAVVAWYVAQLNNIEPVSLLSATEIAISVGLAGSFVVWRRYGTATLEYVLAVALSMPIWLFIAWAFYVGIMISGGAFIDFASNGDATAIFPGIGLAFLIFVGYDFVCWMTGRPSIRDALDRHFSARTDADIAVALAQIEARKRSGKEPEPRRRGALAAVGLSLASALVTRR